MNSTSNTTVSNSTYDFLKALVTMVLPGIGTLYFTIAGIWGLPWAEEVVGTITALVTFLGIVIFVMSKQYKNSDERFDGVIRVSEDENGLRKAFLDLDKYADPADVVEQNEAHFKVVKD